MTTVRRLGPRLHRNDGKPVNMRVTMTEREALALHLVEVEHLPNKEIAAALGITIHSLVGVLRRARDVRIDQRLAEGLRHG